MTPASVSLTARTRWTIACAYVACWVAGLLVGGPQVDPGAGSHALALAFSEQARVLVFAVLVHGVAAVLLALLGLALGSGPTRRLTVSLAATAAVLSFGQLAGEVSLVAGPRHAQASATWESVSRVDGLKMLVLAALVTAVWVGAAHRGRVLTAVSGLAVATLVLSGIGYVTVSTGLMALAGASLPLLLLWSLAATAASVRDATRGAEHGLATEGRA